MLAILRAGGLPPRLAVQGYLLLISTVNGFTVDETGVDDGGADDSGGSPAPRDPAGVQEAANMARDYIASLPTDRPAAQPGGPDRQPRVRGGPCLAVGTGLNSSDTGLNPSEYRAESV
jgi:hypothetical protein